MLVISVRVAAPMEANLLSDLVTEVSLLTGAMRLVGCAGLASWSMSEGLASLAGFSGWAVRSVAALPDPVSWVSGLH